MQHVLFSQINTATHALTACIHLPQSSGFTHSNNSPLVFCIYPSLHVQPGMQIVRQNGGGL